MRVRCQGCLRNSLCDHFLDTKVIDELGMMEGLVWKNGETYKCWENCWRKLFFLNNVPYFSCL